jgi:hypothetical protein
MLTLELRKHHRTLKAHPGASGGKLAMEVLKAYPKIMEPRPGAKEPSSGSMEAQPHVVETLYRAVEANIRNIEAREDLPQSC